MGLSETEGEGRAAILYLDSAWNYKLHTSNCCWMQVHAMYM